jgi:hypothetical protein
MCLQINKLDNLYIQLRNTAWIETVKGQSERIKIQGTIFQN